MNDSIHLLRTIASTIGTLAVKIIPDSVSRGSLLTLSITLEGLLAAETEPSIFGILHQSFSSFPHDESPELNTLFGSVLQVCVLAQDFDRAEAEQLSSDLFSLWKAHQPGSVN